MATGQSSMQATQAAVAVSFQRHWRTFLAEGIVLAILGVLAIAVPQVASVTVAILIGWLLLVSGIVGLVSTLRMRGAPGFGWSLLSAVIAIAAGIILIGQPVSGVMSLTLVLSVFLLCEGVFSILLALQHRREFSGRWAMLVFSGVVDLMLAGLIFAGLPATAAWAIGLLVGINLVFGGLALISMALHARTVPA
jgi:uncharacterized membrane protein HdeD (DUF308 family)